MRRRPVCGIAPVEDVHDLPGELVLGRHRVQTPLLEIPLCRGNFLDRPARDQVEVIRHRLVRKAHDLAVLFLGGLVHADVVPGGFAHPHAPVRAHQDGHGHAYLRLLPVGLLQLSARHQVEELFCGAKLHIGLQYHRVVALHERVEKLVHPHGVARIPPLAEVVSGEKLLYRKMRGQPDDLLKRQHAQPVCVVAHGRPLPVQNFKRLFRVGPRVFGHLLRRLLRPGAVFVRGIANQPGEVPDQKGHLVSQILELA